MFTEFTEKLYSLVSSVPFDTLVWAAWGSYAGIFLITLLGCALSKKIKAAKKGPYLCFTNAYAALTLALFLIKHGLAQAVMIAVLFWIAGYISYGALCALTSVRRTEPPRESKEILLSSMPVSSALPPKSAHPETTAAAKTNVRLEHAVSVTDKLLGKNLGKTDRMELEKLKNTLSVLQLKGTLTPVESDMLNENFNMLLKLMAKYNV